MGMAASQARFLGLTARKTNVEYEGQQVNQQRTALANESSGLFNQMLTLQVPTPPSATDFYNTRYVFGGSDNNDYAITNFSPNASGTYDITMVYQVYQDKAYPTGDRNINTIEFNSGTSVPKTITVGGAVCNVAEVDDPATVELLRQLDGQKNASNFYAYTYTSGTTQVTNYLSSNDLGNLDPAKFTGESYTGTVNKYKISETPTQKKSSGTASFISSSDGRFDTTHIISVNDADLQSLVGQDFSLDMKQVQDDVGYSEAMKDYEYQKMVYERAIQDINAKTEVLQQQDRTLELRLKQLDTEQNALKTEMDAVQKVIKDNIEKTFKTFA